MPDLETTRVITVGAVTLIKVIGGGLGFTVLMAATVPVHEPVKATLVRIPGWCRKALSVALRVVYVVTGARLAYLLAVTYCHVGWKGQKHAYVTRGRHRPAYVKRHTWRPVLTWPVPSVEWTVST